MTERFLYKTMRIASPLDISTIRPPFMSLANFITPAHFCTGNNTKRRQTSSLPCITPLLKQQAIHVRPSTVPRPYVPKLLTRSIALDSENMGSPCSSNGMFKVDRMYCPALPLRDRQDLITYPKPYELSGLPKEQHYDEHHYFQDSRLTVSPIPNSAMIKGCVDFTAIRGLQDGVSMAEILRCRGQALFGPDDPVLGGEAGRRGITVVQFWLVNGSQVMEKRSIALSCRHGPLTRHTLAYNICRLFRDILLPPDLTPAKAAPRIITDEGKIYGCDFLDLRLVSLYTEGAGVWKAQIAVVEEAG